MKSKGLLVCIYKHNHHHHRYHQKKRWWSAYLLFYEYISSDAAEVAGMYQHCAQYTTHAHVQAHMHTAYTYSPTYCMHTYNCSSNCFYICIILLFKLMRNQYHMQLGEQCRNRTWSSYITRLTSICRTSSSSNNYSTPTHNAYTSVWSRTRN